MYDQLHNLQVEISIIGDEYNGRYLEMAHRAGLLIAVSRCTSGSDPQATAWPQSTLASVGQEHPGIKKF